MPGTCDQAANVARKCANANTMEWVVLGGLMCWEAVAHIALLAGIIDETKWKALKGQPGTVFANVLAPVGSPVVLGQAGMAGLAAGQAIVFYHGVTAVHAMISLGGGLAAGNKNDCIGIGKNIGWEILDLTTLKWSGNDIDAPGLLGPSRLLQASYRPITQIA